MANKIHTFFTQTANSSVMLLSSMSRPPDYWDAVYSLANPLSQPAQEKNENEMKDCKYFMISKQLGFSSFQFVLTL